MDAPEEYRYAKYPSAKVFDEQGNEINGEIGYDPWVKKRRDGSPFTSGERTD